MYYLGQYISGHSIIHQLDPRLKIASTLSLSILILNGGAISELVISVFLLIIIAMGQLTYYHIGRALKPMVVFFILLLLLHMLFTNGTPIPPFRPWPITITYEGLYQGLYVVWRFSLLLLSGTILLMTTSPTELIHGVERLLRPFKKIGIPSHDIAVMISIAFRFMPTLLDEANRIKEARMARGARFRGGSPIQRIKANVSLLVPLITSSFRRADELAIAMEGRGYKRGPRTYLTELRFSRSDYIAGVIMILIIGLHALHHYPGK